MHVNKNVSQNYMYKFVEELTSCIASYYGSNERAGACVKKVKTFTSICTNRAITKYFSENVN